MILLSYYDERAVRHSFELDDWDAVTQVMQALSSAPIDLDYVMYQDGAEIGTICLSTFERC